MTAIQQEPQPAALPARLATLRGNCMGAGVLLIVQVALGTGVSLYVTLPKHGTFFAAVFGSALLASHAIVALLLLGAAVGALARAIRVRKGITFTAVGLAAVLVAAFAGASFAGNGASGASLTMALATAVALFCYLAAVFTIR